MDPAYWTSRPEFPILKTGREAWRCHTYDGRGFWCDTDFQKGTPMDMRTLVDATWEDHICITGGEPLLHHKDLSELIEMAAAKMKFVHIETSGTVDWTPDPCWLTCSPKIGFLPRMVDQADEIKLLIDDGFDIAKVPTCIMQHPTVFIQPVNHELTLDQRNIEICRDILRREPHWRLSIQMHKAINWR